MKIFLPGPTMVRPDVLARLCTPIIGHRTPEFRALAAALKPLLGRLFGTIHPVFPLTCTASAAMEAALLNAAGSRPLILSNGHFGERWVLAARALGLKPVPLTFGWAAAWDLTAVESRLSQGGFSSLVAVHGETSTGMLNPLRELAQITAAHSDLVLIADAVSTLGGAELYMDRWGIDVLIGACQKCLALPPGIALVGVSPRAMERSRRSRRKGFAHDFNLWAKRWEQNEPVATPALPQFHALLYQLGRIEAETLPARWQRHQRMATMVETWAKEAGWRLLCPPGYRLPSVSCLEPPDGSGTTPLAEALRRRGYLVSDGFAQLKGKTLRLGHMGDWTEAELGDLLQVMTELDKRK